MNSREGLATSSRPMFTRFLCPPLHGAGSGLGSCSMWGDAYFPVVSRQRCSAAWDTLTHNVLTVVSCCGQVRRASGQQQKGSQSAWAVCCCRIPLLCHRSPDATLLHRANH